MAKLRCQNVHLVPKIVCRYRVLHAPIIPNLNCISMKITYFCNFLLVPPALIRIYWEIWKKMLCFVTLDCFTNILTIFACSHWVTPGDWASQKELKRKKKNKLLNPIKSKKQRYVKNLRKFVKLQQGFRNFVSIMTTSDLVERSFKFR